MLLLKNCKILVGDRLENKGILVNELGKIEKISAPSSIKSSDEIVDARGNIALPGVIDAHVHCREPGLTGKEDFRSASMAAAAGGVTTFIDMPNSSPPTTSVKLLDEKRRIASERCIVNFGFHFGAATSNLGEIKKAGNIAALKVYMGSSTGDLLVTGESQLEGIFGAGRRIAAHAENEDAIKRNIKAYRNECIRDIPSFHLKIRDSRLAKSEVERAISIAKKKSARLHICHISTAGEASAVKANKSSMTLSCEVTPHHLFLSAEKASKLGNYAKVNPPLRSEKEISELWKYINDGTIDMVATDHAPHLREEKEQDYWHAPSGMPGLETMMPLMLDAVNRNALSLQKLVELASSSPASVFGIRGKGRIEQGFDGDFTIVDMKKTKTIKNDELFTKCGWSPFNGWKLKGAVTHTIVCGRLVFNNGEIASNSPGKEADFDV
ncbi:dihydroorotase [Candidatus Woesearchaeota archaeon]|nr:dihydroorotase [Candidatus Woesearchaeota archaeon]